MRQARLVGLILVEPGCPLTAGESLLLLLALRVAARGIVVVVGDRGRVLATGFLRLATARH